MTLFEWMAFKYPDEYDSAEEAKEMFLFFIDAEQRHYGDCTKDINICLLCLVQNLLDEYEKYCKEKGVIK